MEVEELRRRVRALMPRARSDLGELVAIPSVADPRQYPPERCLEAAEWVRSAITDAGLDNCRLLEVPDGHPAVFGELPARDGGPTVLLYCHYDVQPPLDEDAWSSPPFELTERDGRWYGRGAADCKGNVIAHLTALRALEGSFGVGIKLLSEGAEEQATGGLEAFVRSNADLLNADAVVILDAGNFAIGVPTITITLRGVVEVVVRVRSLEGPMHSGAFGGPAPDALLALVRMLASLYDDRANVAIEGIGTDQSWNGIDYPTDQFRRDARVLDEVELVGDGSVAAMLWARPSITVLGIDCPPVLGSTPSVQAAAAARVSVRIPPGSDPDAALQALTSALRSAAPWRVETEIEPVKSGAPFEAGTGGPAFQCMSASLAAAFGHAASTQGQGGSIPLCNALAEVLPEAEIMLMGVEEPRCLMHAPNESVDPSELAGIALAEAQFLSTYGV